MVRICCAPMNGMMRTAERDLGSQESPIANPARWQLLQREAAVPADAEYPAVEAPTRAPEFIVHRDLVL
jgi:hypothetical protein